MPAIKKTMSPTIKNLCWKEFHELKSGASAAAAIALAIPLCYVARDLTSAYLGVHTALAVYPLLAGVFFGMRAAAGERTNRTAPFVAALPVSHTLLGIVRLVAVLIAAAVPLALLVLLGAVLLRFADDNAHSQAMPLASFAGWCSLATAACLTIVARAGLGQATEVRAAVVGFAALIGVFIAVYCGAMYLLSMLRMLHVDHVLLGPEAGLRSPLILAITGAVAVVIMFAISFATNYSLALDLPTVRSAKSWSLIDWVPTPIPAHISTLLWKGTREMGVLGLYVFIISLLLSIVAGTFGLTSNHPTRVAELIMQSLPAILWVGGFVLAILIGVGAVIGDLQPGVNTFWRSRPISPRAWYWTKYGIGLATILLAIEIPFVLNPYALAISDHGGLLWWPLVWNVTFSFALTFTCLVRQPAHAAILAVGAAGILYAVVQATFGSFTPGEPPAPIAILATAFLIAFALSTLLGAWAAKHDVAIS